MASTKQFPENARETQSDVGASDRATRDPTTLNADGRPIERTSLLPIAAVMIAACFAAGAWYYYQQDSRDSYREASVTSPDENANSRAAIPTVSDSQGATATTTFAQSPSFGKPDIVVTVHPDPAQTQTLAARPTVARTMLAKATRPGKSVVSPTRIDRDVALTTRPRPVYPAQALRTREQGTVLVLAHVDTSGQVSDARVVRRSGSPTLDRAAPNEVRRWKFAPALHDGQPIVASVEVPVSYRLEP